MARLIDFISDLLFAFVEWVGDQLRFPRTPRCRFSDLLLWDSWRARFEIWQLRKLFEKYGPVDHIREVVARSRFAGGAPLSLAFEPEALTFRCSNARQSQYFKRWPAKLRFLRMLWFLEGYFSSLVAREQFEAGDRHLLSSRGISPEVATSQIVEDLREKYRVLKRVDRMFRERLRTRAGVRLTMAALYSEDSWALMEVIARSLAVFPETVEMQIAALHRRSTDEFTMWRICSSAVLEILNHLATLAAAFDDTSDWTWRQARLFDDEVFARFFGDSWPTLHGDLRASMLRSYDDNKENADAKQAVKDIFARMGIGIRSEITGTMSMLEVTPPVAGPHPPAMQT